ncbi:MAG: globin [Acidimicrobiia bacterium]|nr:globin [Acidimicrobiia bacterium]
MTDPTASQAGPSVYERVGCQPFFDALVDRFYDAVEADPVLEPMYPSDDMAGARARLAGFLAQYWGGPTHYSDERGHPRLRMRHNPFTIGPIEREHWLAHMLGSVRMADLAVDVSEQMVAYFEAAATAMVNSPIRVAGPEAGNA